VNGWVVDTCVVLDLAVNDPQFGLASARFMQQKLSEGLLIAPVTFVELAPVFGGRMEALKQFLVGARIGWQEPWTLADTEASFGGWARYVDLKRRGQASKRPVADLLIGAYAGRFRGLITRNPDDFTRFFPALNVVAP
jgi:predicted nucleic acid-binding protein